MGQALLDREREDVNRRSLNLSMFGQRRDQDWVRVLLYNGRTDALEWSA